MLIRCENEAFVPSLHLAHKACNFKTIKGKEVLVCDERMLRKVKSINYENRDCEKFEYVTVINGVEEENDYADMRAASHRARYNSAMKPCHSMKKLPRG